MQLLHTLSVANHNDYSYEQTENHQVTLRWSVKLCEAKTESDGKPVLVKMYEATWDLRHKEVRVSMLLISYQDVWDPSIAAFLGYSNAQDNVLLQVFHNPGSEPASSFHED
ncbi:hypothetical protein BU17DRAFT_71663 [Hysterangium stoloniferum]|nr:hypothetical protein BU17DRAFT_71663 [Hysterangium stoloniferum]